MPVKAKKSPINISLTDFLDFVNCIGSSKQSKVKQIKTRGPYKPPFDFYKTFRESLIDIHIQGGTTSDLDGIMSLLTDTKKISNYPDILKGYKKFWGKKKIDWFTPPTKKWIIGDTSVNINPELGIEMHGKLYVIKLYFKSDKLSKNRCNQILSLMEKELRKKAAPEVIFCVLDIRKSKLYTNKIGDTSQYPLLMGEIASFETIWKLI